MCGLLNRAFLIRMEGDSVGEFTLTARAPLGSLDKSFDGISLKTPEPTGLLALSVSRDGEPGLNEALQRTVDCQWPAVGQSAISNSGHATVLRLSREHALIQFDESAVAAGQLIDGLSSVAWLADQSDSWAALWIDGSRSREMLERTCMLDLDATVFDRGAVARTRMEHLAVIIYRQTDNGFLLLSATSSAASFLHMIQTSIRNAF